MLSGMFKLLAWMVGVVLLFVLLVDQANAQPPTYVPWQAGATYRVTQGNGGSYSHYDQYNRYAWDFALPSGTNVLAAAPGEVIYAGWSSQGWGNTVVVCYGDGTCSRYAHLSWVGVGLGHVSQAQLLGRSGSTGRSSAPHLHYGLENRSGTSLPSQFVEAGVPRAGDSVTSRNNGDPTPLFDDVHVYAGEVLPVQAGDTVNAVVTARYLGPGLIACGQANLGVRDDSPAKFGDWRNGFWPNSNWRSPNRVAAFDCQGNLDPGEHAAWHLPFHVPLDTSSGDYLTGVYAPVREGVAWSGVRVPITLRVRGQYNAEFAGQSVTPLVAPGSTGSVSVALRNAGPATWSRDQVRLGTVDDRPFPYADSSWLNANRIQMREQSVAPGQVAHFEATFSVPPNAVPSRYRQEFAPVVEGRQWFDRAIGIHLWFFVGDENHLPYLTEDYGAQRIDQTYHQGSLSRGQTASVTVTYRNAGWASWFAGGQHPVQYRGCRPSDRQSGFIDPAAPSAVGTNRTQGVRLGQNRVNPGETVTITLPLKVADWVNPGMYQEYFCLVAEGTSWFGPNDVWWPFSVN